MNTPEVDNDDTLIVNNNSNNNNNDDSKKNVMTKNTKTKIMNNDNNWMISMG